MLNKPLHLLEAFAVLALMSAVLLGGFTLFYTMPTFTALQQRGIQKTALVLQKVPYRFGCVGRGACKDYLFKIEFFAADSNTALQDSSNVLHTEVEVSQTIFEKTNPQDNIRIIYLEENPKDVWLAEPALRWTPWTNMLVTFGLSLLGGILLSWQRQRAE